MLLRNGICKIDYWEVDSMIGYYIFLGLVILAAAINDGLRHIANAIRSKK